MGNDTFQAVTLAMSAMSVEFGALVSVFIVYAADQITSSVRNIGSAGDGSPLNVFILSRFNFLLTAAGLSTLTLIASPVVSIVSLFIFNQAKYFVMLFEIFMFSLGTWIIIGSLAVFLFHELSIFRMYISSFQ